MPDTTPQSLILIVDDNPTNRNLLQAQLGHAGFTRLALAESGPDALELIREQRPDLILLDVMMPGMDGYEVVERIRADYSDQFIPIILLTALQETEERIKGIRAGANDYLAKPYDLDELHTRIQSWLGHKQAVEELKSERARLALLYAISQTLNSQLDYQETINAIISLTIGLIGAAKAMLVLLDDQGRFKQRIVARPGEGATTLDTVDPTVLDEGLIGWVTRNNEPVLITDVSHDDRWKQLPGDDDLTASVIAVPLVRGGRMIGVLMLTASEADAFNAEQVQLLSAIGNQAGIALENASLYEEARRERIKAEALLTQVGDPLVVTDLNGIVTRYNPAAGATFGLEPSAISQPLHKAFDLLLADLLLRAQERSGAVSGEYTRKRGTIGEGKSFNVSVSPIENVGFLLNWQDITGLKESERARLNEERAQTRLVLDAFSRYMSPTLVERILGDRDILTRHERREAVVLFADLRGFTSLTVKHQPDAVLALLNDIFTGMLDIISRNEGLVFDITGDELMVAFNVPYDQEHFSLRALQTAADMQTEFVTRQARWAAQGMKVGMGIGVNRGPVVLGNVGGSKHMNYSMVGETVNIAHRLVEVAKHSEIIVTPQVLGDGLPLDPTLIVRELPPRKVKGKRQPQPMVMLKLE